MEPLISVIVPAYNSEKYIGRCIESILNQTYKNLEIVIVNDGSTDKTGEILDLYASRYNKNTWQKIVVVHKKNGGIASARNAGLEMAKGEYIGFIDHDDTIEKDMYEILIKNALEHNADISHCGCKTIFPEEIKKNCCDTGKTLVRDKQQEIIRLFKLTDGIPTIWNKLYKANLFSELKFDEKIKIGLDDFLINFSLFSKSNKIVYIDATKYNWYQISTSASNNPPKSLQFMKERYSVYSDILKRADPLQKEIYSAAFNIYVRSIFSVLKHEEDIPNDELKIFQKEMEQKLKEHASAIIKAKKINVKYKIDVIGILYIPFYIKIRYQWTYHKRKRKKQTLRRG